MAEKQPITYADSRADLPTNGFAQKLADLRIARLFAERAKAAEQDNAPNHIRDTSTTSRDAVRHPHGAPDPSMVAKEQPHPVLKPTPSFAADIDAAAFNARWDAERQRNTPSHSPQTLKGDRPMSDDSNTPRRPEETLREGPLKAAIWRNENEKGAFHTVTVARTYKDRDGKLQDTNSMRSQDMLCLSELARRAHHQVRDLDRDLFKEQRRDGQEQGQSKGHDRSR